MSNYDIFVWVVITVLVLVAWYYKYKAKKAVADKKKTYSQKKSSEVRLGQIAENLVPFLKECEMYDPKTMHFMGAPIDYMVFDDDKVVFLEVKTGKSRLSDVQKKIKKQIDQKKVEWKTIRIK